MTTCILWWTSSDGQNSMNCGEYPDLETAWTDVPRIANFLEDEWEQSFGHIPGMEYDRGEFSLEEI